LIGSSGPVHIFGTGYPTPDGTCVHDYIHIYDLAHAHLLVLRALEDSDQRIYNLGNVTGISIREVIAAARGVTARDIPSIDFPRRPGDPPTLVAGSERIRHDRHWTPQYPTSTTFFLPLGSP
jgi:UDP-glucose 4-epimerase